jgi:hypothetical protein
VCVRRSRTVHADDPFLIEVLLNGRCHVIMFSFGTDSYILIRYVNSSVLSTWYRRLITHNLTKWIWPGTLPPTVFIQMLMTEYVVKTQSKLKADLWSDCTKTQMDIISSHENCGNTTHFMLNNNFSRLLWHIFQYIID